MRSDRKQVIVSLVIFKKSRNSSSSLIITEPVTVPQTLHKLTRLKHWSAKLCSRYSQFTVSTIRTVLNWYPCDTRTISMRHLCDTHVIRSNSQVGYIPEWTTLPSCKHMLLRCGWAKMSLARLQRSCRPITDRTYFGDWQEKSTSGARSLCGAFKSFFSQDKLCPGTVQGNLNFIPSQVMALIRGRAGWPERLPWSSFLSFFWHKWRKLAALIFQEPDSPAPPALGARFCSFFPANHGHGMISPSSTIHHIVQIVQVSF